MDQTGDIKNVKIRLTTPNFPGGSEGKASAYNAGDLGSIPGSGRSPGEGSGNTPEFLPRESHGRRSLVGYSPRGHKESDMTERPHLSLVSGSGCVWVSQTMMQGSGGRALELTCLSPKPSPVTYSCVTLSKFHSLSELPMRAPC